MTALRNTMLGALTLLTAAVAAGCGTQGLPTVNTQAGARSAAPTIMAAGVERKLGYDMTRYEKTKAKHEKPIRMPRQGLLPTAIDNREFCSPVADQGKLGSCTAFAMGKGMREYLQRKNGEAQKPLSALWLYYEERVLNGSLSYDSGATIDEGMEVLSEKGCATETLWPYDIAQFKVKPSDEANASAAEFKIHDAKQLAGLDDVKAALAAGQTVAYGFRVYESFRKIGADGLMPVPASGEKLLGGHAVLAVGYNDEKKVLIVRNSWGEKWGDKGYFYMPYSVAGSSAARQFYTASK